MMYATYVFMILGLATPLKEPATRCAPEAVVTLGGAASPSRDDPQYVYGDVEALNPLDAFGAAGAYNRSKLARLYSSARATVVHGWHRDGERFVSITLISPYPDATLSRLNRGTMEIRFTYNFTIRQ